MDRTLLVACVLGLGLGCGTERVAALVTYRACREAREACLAPCIAGNMGLGREHARYHCTTPGDSQYEQYRCGPPCVHPWDGPDEP